jgi:hypothetical protein
LLIVSIGGNIGIDWKSQKFTFGSQRRVRSRSCGDCVRIIISKCTVHFFNFNKNHTSILRQQMVFAEHKIIEIEQIVKSELHSRFKDEIRRSFKDNGFNNMNESDYANYIDERVETLSTLINFKNKKIDFIIKEIYDNAKSVKIRIEQEIKNEEDAFIKDIDKFSKSAE